MPIVRTFITVLAGVGKMDFRHFLIYSSIGGVLWAGGITLLGYLLGDVPWVKNNIEIIAILIVVLSVLPAGFEWLQGAGRRARRRRRQRPTRPEPSAPPLRRGAASRAAARPGAADGCAEPPARRPATGSCVRSE